MLKVWAKAGNYWAHLSVTGLEGLTFGLLSKDNIFVRPNPMAREFEQYFVILPGCKATLERHFDDHYKIVDLVIDSGYFEMNSRNDMAGLYKAEKFNERWRVEYLKNGELIPNAGRKQRIVGISDGVYADAEKAANSMAPLVSKAPGSGGVFFDEYDLHYTPGKATLGGLRNYKLAVNPLSNEAIHGSAIMLAHTMYEAKDIKGVVWVSEFGGSAVLTQAMRILVDQGVKLDKHSAYLYRPNTSPNQVVKLAHQLGIKLGRNFVKTNIHDYMGNRDQISMIFNRVKAERKGNYTIGNACWDLVCQARSIQGLAGLATVAAVAVGIAIATSTLHILEFIGVALVVTVGVLILGDWLAENIAPRWYHQHIGKIK